MGCLEDPRSPGTPGIPWGLGPAGCDLGLPLVASGSLLGVGLFQEWDPELVPLIRTHGHQLPLTHRQPVVHHDIYPAAKLPELVGEGEGPGLGFPPPTLLGPNL